MGHPPDTVKAHQSHDERLGRPMQMGTARESDMRPSTRSMRAVAEEGDMPMDGDLFSEPGSVTRSLSPERALPATGRVAMTPI
jgi:hypothetical protein